MPLIMLCGGPLSGKTLLTKQLEQAAKELYPEREVVVLSHETMNVSRHVFANMPTEKKFNQKLISAVEQALTSKRILIVDYICITKSLRYQFYGKANFTGTVSCVVNCTTPYEATLERNTKDQRYTPEIFEDLWNRLEPPIDTCRWDHPCFNFDCTDVSSYEITNDNTIHPQYTQFQAVLQSICENSTKKLSRSNLPTRNESGGFVTILDTITTCIVEQIITQQQEKGFVVGALLDSSTCQVEVDISKFIESHPITPLSTEDSTQPINSILTQTQSDTSTSSIEPTSSIIEPPPTSAPSTTTTGFKLVRKTVRGKKNSANEPISLQTKFILTLQSPMSPSSLFELKQSFVRIATMMNVKTSHQISKAFVDYLQPQLNPI